MSNLPRYLLFSATFLVGCLLGIGQLIPGDTGQVAAGESLPQTLLWIFAVTLIGMIYLLESNATEPSLCDVLPPELQQSSRVPSKRVWLERTATTVAIASALLGWGWVVLATFNVHGSGNLRYAVNALWQWVTFILIVGAIRWLNVRFRIERMAIRLMIGLAFASAVHGLYQITISLPYDRERFKADPEAVLREAGIVAPPGSATYLLFEGRLQDSSPTGPFGLTNSLAGFVAPWLVALFCIWLYSKAPITAWKKWMGLQSR